MNSGDLKTYKCVKISKSNFFTITILSLHSICSESKKRILKKILVPCHVYKLILTWKIKQHSSILTFKEMVFCVYVFLIFLFNNYNFWFWEARNYFAKCFFFLIYLFISFTFNFVKHSLLFIGIFLGLILVSVAETGSEHCRLFETSQINHQKKYYLTLYTSLFAFHF